MYLKYKVISPEIAFVRCDVGKFEHCNGRLRHPHCAVWRSNSLAVNYQQMFNSLIVKQSNTITGNSHLSKLNTCWNWAWHFDSPFSSPKFWPRESSRLCIRCGLKLWVPSTSSPHKWFMIRRNLKKYGVTRMVFDTDF